MQYRRLYTAGATYFFTVNLQDRKSDLLIREIDLLRKCFRKVKQKHPFEINAIAILPDHIHAIWTMPQDDADFSKRWRLIKYYFSHALKNTDEHISESRAQKQERGIWQRRFWEHKIRNQEDYNNHVNYIHYNPLKHGYVQKAKDWEYSSFHKYVEQGIYDMDWCGEL